MKKTDPSLAFTVKWISQKIKIRAVVPIRQDDPRFGKKNINLEVDRYILSTPDTCPICMVEWDSKKTVPHAYQICGHVCCETCWDTIMKNGKQCPHCRVKIHLLTETNLLSLYCEAPPNACESYKARIERLKRQEEQQKRKADRKTAVDGRDKLSQKWS